MLRLEESVEEGSESSTLSVLFYWSSGLLDRGSIIHCMEASEERLLVFCFDHLLLRGREGLSRWEKGRGYLDWLGISRWLKSVRI